MNALRREIFTASEIHKLITNGSSYEPCEFTTEFQCYELLRDNGYVPITEPPKKGKKCYRYNEDHMTDGAIDYCIEKANAVLYHDREEPELDTFATRYGKDHEHLAIEYLISKGHDLVFTGENQRFFVHESGMMGATPDGVELDDCFNIETVWDVKTPSQKNHTWNCLNLLTHHGLKKHYPAYYWQGLCQMECTGSNVFYWVSFAPDKIGDTLRTCVIVIHRDMVLDDINFMMKCVTKAHKFKLEIIERLK